MEIIPTLKNKIKDLERQATYELSKSNLNNPLKTLNSANRDIDYSKTQNSGNVIHFLIIINLYVLLRIFHIKISIIMKFLDLLERIVKHQYFYLVHQN